VEVVESDVFPPRSWVFDPGLLLGDQALHELGPFPLVGLDTFVQQHLADLRDGPLFLIGDSLNVSPQRRNPERFVSTNHIEATGISAAGNRFY
jgi:hypothetical protein